MISLWFGGLFTCSDLCWDLHNTINIPEIYQVFMTVRRIIMVCIFRTCRKTSHELYVIFFLKKTKANLFSSL